MTRWGLASASVGLFGGRGHDSRALTAGTGDACGGSAAQQMVVTDAAAGVLPGSPPAAGWEWVPDIAPDVPPDVEPNATPDAVLGVLNSDDASAPADVAVPFDGEEPP